VIPEVLEKLSWTILALIHVPPASVSVAPALIGRLYGVEAGSDMGILLMHRGVLFLAIVVACLVAALHVTARPLACVLVALSIMGFLAIYAYGGMPTGPLRTIAVADTVALLPLLYVIVRQFLA
jgi:hypothetical protein